MVLLQADDHTFEFPDIRPDLEGDTPEESLEMKEYNKLKEEEKVTQQKYWDKSDIPQWFR